MSAVNGQIKTRRLEMTNPFLGSDDVGVWRKEITSDDHWTISQFDGTNFHDSLKVGGGTPVFSASAVNGFTIKASNATDPSFQVYDHSGTLSMNVFPSGTMELGSIIPFTDSTYSLGATTLQWNSIYTNSVTVNGVLTSTSTYKAAEDLAAGQPVTAFTDLDGTDNVKSVENAGIKGGEETFESGATTYNDVIKLDDTRVFVTWYETASANGYCRIGTIVGGHVIWTGQPYVFSNTQVAYNRCAKINTDKVMLFYQETSSTDARARVASITGEVITFGTEFIVDNLLATTYHSMDYLDTDKAAVVWRSGVLLKFAILTAPSTTITSSVAYTVIASTDAQRLHVISLDTTHAVVSWVQSSQRFDIVLDVTTPNSPSPGSSLAYGATTFLTAMSKVDSTTYVALFYATTSYPHSKVNTVAGTAITAGITQLIAERQFLGNDFGSVEYLGNNQVLIEYCWTASGESRLVYGYVQNGTVGWFKEEIINNYNPSSNGYENIATLGNGRWVAIYQDTADSNKGKSRTGIIKSVREPIFYRPSGTDTGNSNQQWASVAVNAYYLASIGPTTTDLRVSIWRNKGNPREIVLHSFNTLAASTPTEVVATLIAENKIAIVYKHGGTSNRAIVIATIDSSGNVSFGTPQNVSTNNTGYPAIAQLDTDKIIVAYRDITDASKGKLRVGTISGTVVTFGTAVDYIATDASLIAYRLISHTTDAFVLAYKDDDIASNPGFVLAGTVSGTVPTLGTAVQFTTGDVTKYGLNTLDSTRFLLNMSDPDDSSNGKVVIGTLAGTAITLGTKYQFDTVAVDTSFVVAKDTSTIMVTYRNSTNTRVRYIMGDIDSGVITFRASSTLYTADLMNTNYPQTVFLVPTLSVTHFINTTNVTHYNFITEWEHNIPSQEYLFSSTFGRHPHITRLDDFRFVVFFTDTDYYPWARVGELVGDTITWHAQIQISTSTTHTTSECMVEKLDADKVVFVYTNSAGGTIYTKAATINPNTHAITLGSEQVLTTSKNPANDSISITLLDTDKVVVLWEFLTNTYPYGILITFSGTVATFGSAKLLESQATNPSNGPVSNVVAVDTQRVVSAYKTATDTRYTLWNTYTDTVSSGSIEGPGRFVRIFKYDSTRVIAFYSTGGYEVGVLNGNSINWLGGFNLGLLKTGGGNDKFTMSWVSQNNFILCFKDGSPSPGYYCLGIFDPDNNTISTHNIRRLPIEVLSANNELIHVNSINYRQAVLVYSDSENVKAGTATIIYPEDDLPIGVTTEAITKNTTGQIALKGTVATGLTGLTTGFNYYVKNGQLTTEPTDRKIGYALTDTKLNIV